MTTTPGFTAGQLYGIVGVELVTSRIESALSVSDQGTNLGIPP